jgi:hypothetical protein
VWHDAQLPIPLFDVGLVDTYCINPVTQPVGTLPQIMKSIPKILPNQKLFPVNKYILFEGFVPPHI